MAIRSSSSGQTTPDMRGLRDDGYQILRGALSPATVGSVHRFLERSLDLAFTEMASCGIRKDDPENGRRVTETLAQSAQGTLSDGLKHVLLGHFPLAVRLSEELWAIPRDPGLQAILHAAFGNVRIFMHMPPAARFVLPQNFGAAVPPHQDITYNQHMGEFLTVWVPLVEIDDQCGGMTVYEGSQNEAELRDDGTWDQWREGISTKGFRSRPCRPMSPGDLIIFNQRLIHVSQPNLSNRTRLSVDMRFFPETVISRKHSLDVQEWRVLPPGARG